MSERIPRPESRTGQQDLGVGRLATAEQVELVHQAVHQARRGAGPCLAAAGTRQHPFAQLPAPDRQGGKPPLQMIVDAQ